MSAVIECRVSCGDACDAMPLTLLVVDDDLGIRVAVGDYLETQGYSVTTVASGRAALEAIGRIHPHLMVVDIAMPEMSGYELIRRVRSDASMRLLPVIFLTARNETADRILGYQVGCDSYLAKPFELEELSAIVRNLLDRNQMVMDWRALAMMTESSRMESSRMEPSRMEPSVRSQDAKQRSLALDLTPREQDVIGLLGHGLSNPQIGEKLHLSARTIEKYVSSLFRKTDTTNRAELLRYAIEHQLL
jgi:DNA-binding NarL/FixJ family response regulator